ncbi:MAG TPA: L-seryl-tRNA(Sec) selenium transferase, partial [Anaerolineales bacterium]|nr:L-seryl-tRNA(Sec) selenium transferase [Anaerolineales bacterium]
LPSVERLLQTEAGEALRSEFGHSLSVQAVRTALENARAAIRSGGASPSTEDILKEARHWMQAAVEPSLRPVVNATGVILHTNLGRAVLSREAQQAVQAAASSYTTLEYDLERGERGQRGLHAEPLLRQLTGAEAALVVNNNAAAVLLALAALAGRRRVVVSRSQLVEIGGGFRIPEILKQSGAKLVEVGTTNRTHRRDYEAALAEGAALVLRAHHSNFKIVGFTREPGLVELVEVGEKFGVPVLDDLGSGALLDTADFGLGHEPMVQESLQAGAALVAFSGDKLLGGPQAGLLVGKAELIERLRRHPLARAVRPDKLCLAALSATLVHYVKNEAVERVPVWRMIAARESDLRARAETWAALLGGEIRAGRSTIGGGSLPEETLPTWIVALPGSHPDALAEDLRRQDPPVIARIEQSGLVLDPRSVLPEEDEVLLAGVQRSLAHAGKPGVRGE